MSRGAVIFALVFVSLFATLVECRPYYRWFDYDFAPQAKPVQDTGAGQVLGTVNPLRPYEPWVLDCNLLFHADPGKRHPRCKEVDEQNEKEYARFLLHVQQWEEAYPDRAERWNTRFPEAKESEKKKYQQLKVFMESHKPNVELEEPGLSTISSSTQRAECKDDANCNNNPNVASTGQVEEEASEEIPDSAEGPGLEQ